MLVCQRIKAIQNSEGFSFRMYFVYCNNGNAITDIDEPLFMSKSQTTGPSSARRISHKKCSHIYTVTTLDVSL